MTKPVHPTPSYWFGDQTPPWHARALAAGYAAAIALRMRLLRAGVLRQIRIDRPVLVIGNLIAGGSGKTPLVIAIVERLQAAGFTPGVATRGYGRDDAGTARWVEAGTDPTLGGDEPVLLAQRTHARVRADADRVAAARALIAAGCDIVVCDDGLQHYRLRRDVEIEVIDGRRRHGNG
ncbi:MAG: tetraacyldisaccharide 4'-kinase, partial [Luteimonas sp.]